MYNALLGTNYDNKSEIRIYTIDSAVVDCIDTAVDMCFTEFDEEEFVNGIREELL